MNPFKAALDSKLGRKLRGISVVDNAANPASAYNKVKRSMQSAGTGSNPQNRTLEKNLGKIYSKPAGKTFGTPYK